MKNNEEVLSFIWQNADMGIIGISSVLKFVNNEDFKELLEEQMEEYNKICEKVGDLMLESNDEEKYKDSSKISEIRTNLMSNMKLMKDKSISNVAKMMIEGTNRGIIEIQEKINSYKISDKKVEKLAMEFKDMLEHNLDELKKYL